jgi:hypothetical protein
VLAAGRHHLHPLSRAVCGSPGAGVSHRRPALYPADTRFERRAVVGDFPAAKGDPPVYGDYRRIETGRR